VFLESKAVYFSLGRTPAHGPSEGAGLNINITVTTTALVATSLIINLRSKTFFTGL
jgi:hypothetical protein